MTISLEPEGAELGTGAQLREAEIENLDAAAGQDDVGGFEIAMDDALGVSGGERVGDLDGVRQHTLSSGMGPCLISVRESVALDELHDQVIRANVVERADVGVVERGDGLGFALKAVAELARGNFDGDGPAEAGVGAAVDLAHAAFAEEGIDAIGPERVAGLSAGSGAWLAMM